MTDLVEALLSAGPPDLLTIDEEIKHLEDRIEKLRKARAVLAVMFDARPAAAMFPAPTPVAGLTAVARVTPAEVERLLADVPASPRKPPKPKPPEPARAAASAVFKEAVETLLSDGHPRSLPAIARATGSFAGGPLAMRLAKLGFVKGPGGWSQPGVTRPYNAAVVTSDAATREPCVPVLPPVVPVREEVRLALGEVPITPSPPITTLPAKLEPPAARPKPPPIPEGTKRYRLFRDNGNGPVADRRAVLVASFDDRIDAEVECDRINRRSEHIHYLFDAGA